jgi:hypothetical protein
MKRRKQKKKLREKEHRESLRLFGYEPTFNFI